MDTDRLATILARRLAGKVCVDHDSLSSASRDFGGIVECRPRVVVWPDNTDDVIAIVRTAREMKTSLAVRGAGHSQGGQALNRGGIVLQTQHLNFVDAFNDADGLITAGAGLLWSDLVDTTIACRLLPMVLTDNLKVTVGGTLSIGGLGPASFRHGAQIDNSQSLEVVLGTGDVVWLSAKHQPRLFQHVLGGLGQFGVITRARVRLRPASRFIRTYYLTYDNIATLLTDAQQLMTRESVHLLSGFAVPRQDENAAPSHDFTLAVSVEVDQIPSDDQQHTVVGTSPDVRSEEIVPTSDYFAQLEDTFEHFQRPTQSNVAHPWVEHFLPISAVPKYILAVTAQFPTASLLLWPMRTSSFHQPMFCLPAVDDVMLVGILCSPPHADIAEVLPRLRNVDQLGVALGGKRYLSGWLGFTIERWGQHFGVKRWNEITALQRQFDPDHLFTLWGR